MRNIEFYKYRLKQKGQEFDVYVPKKVPEQLWVSVHKEDPTYIDGNLEGFRTLLEAFKIMCINNRAIVYFPLRKSPYASRFWYEPQSFHEIQFIGYDLVLFNAYNNIKNSDWIKLKKKFFKHAKRETYHVGKDKFDRKRALKVSQKDDIELKGNKIPFETITGSTLFCRGHHFEYCKFIFQLEDYLKFEGSLAKYWWNENSWRYSFPYSAVPNEWLHNHYYNNHKTVSNCFELGFYDVHMADKLKVYDETLANTYALELKHFLDRREIKEQIDLNKFMNESISRLLYSRTNDDKEVGKLFYEYLKSSNKAFIDQYKVTTLLYRKYKTVRELYE